MSKRIASNAKQKSVVPSARRRVMRAVPPAPPPPSWTEEAGIVRDLWGVIARRWRVVAWTMGVIVGLTALYCFFGTKYYMGQSTVLIEGRAIPVLTGQNEAEAQSPFIASKYDYYQTQFNLLRSPGLIRRVILDLGLDHDKRFVPPPPPWWWGWWKTPKPPMLIGGVDPALVTQYLKLLTVQPVLSTRLVQVQFQITDPDLAADVANAHARIFVRGSLERLYSSMEQIRGFLQSKLAELQPRMQEAQRKLLEFESAHHMLPVDVKNDIANDRLKDLSQRLTGAEAERIALEAQYRLIENRDYESLPAVLASPLIQKLREDLNKLEVDHALLARRFRPTYPKLQELGGQLGHARALVRKETEKVVKGVEANYRAAQRNADQLRAEMEAQRQALVDRKDEEGEFLALVRDAETNQALYDNILTRVKQIDVVGGSDASNITVAEMATTPQFPSWPMTKIFLALGVVTGLIFGTGLAFLRDAWDRTIRDSRSLRSATGLGTLAIIPDFDGTPPASLPERFRRHGARARQLAGRGLQRIGRLATRNGTKAMRPISTVISPRLLLGNGHESPSAEAYRTLRTSLLLCRTPASPRVILITSAVGTEGKTTTAVNTAAALASSGAPVLLVDGDLRLPRCDQTLGMPLAPGLSEYLTGELNAEPIQQTRIENLSFLAAGRLGPNPTQLLTSWRMGMLLWHARQTFDFIIIDSPPLLAVSDALLLASLADGVILVVERGRSREDSVQLALQRLQQAGAVPLGTVLNRCEIEQEYYRYSRYRDVVAPPPVRGAADSAVTIDTGSEGEEA